MTRVIRLLGTACGTWWDVMWLADSTPVECGRSKETAERSDLVGWAGYGYCASHSRRAATLDERNRIAREIHDVLAHSLGSLGVQIQAARAFDLLTRAQRSAAEGLVETRRALQALRTDTPPLADALDDLGAEHQHQYLTPVTVEVTGRPQPLTPDAALALTRAVQESFVNAAKHAPLQPVVVRLDFTDGPTTLTVLNPLTDSRPTEPRLETANGGYGLGGMRERLRLIGGSLEAHTSEGNWVVTAQVPQ